MILSNPIGGRFFQKKYSYEAGYDYYRSICKHCSSVQGDHFIISEYIVNYGTVNKKTCND